MRELELPCRSCGAQPGQPCQAGGADTPLTHDVRIFAAMFTDEESEASR